MHGSEEPLPISCFIIAMNEADRIGAAIRSVRGWVDEVLVIDSGSTDGTVGVAAAEGAGVISNPWPGFGQQKRFAEERCRNAWLLNIDADEVITPELGAEIRALFKHAQPDRAAYGMHITLVYPGWKRPRFWARDHYCLRLYDRRRVRFREATLHDSVVPGNEPVGHLQGVIHHHSIRSLGDLACKCDARASYQARHAGHMPAWQLRLRLCTELPASFFKYYVARRHVTGGLMGLAVSTIMAYYRWIRIFRIYRHLQQHRNITAGQLRPSSPRTPAATSMAGRRNTVCICTRGRSASFARCLSSVLAQELPAANGQLCVIVVDNSDVGTERGHVEALIRGSRPVSYVHEPRRGIPFARNAALDAALSLDPAWIAFLDDDEVAPHGWLSRLVQVAELTGADVVHGGVVSASSAEISGLAASWRPSGALPKSRRTHKAATNNVLLRPWIVRDPVGLRFDEHMGETGGSDGEFFMRASDAGAQIVRTRDAPVFEERSDERETPAYRRLRAFRVGTNCNYRYRKNRRPGILAALLILGRAIGSSARAALKASLSLPMLAVNRRRASALAQRGLIDACFAWGCVAPYFGVRPKTYY